MSSNNDPDARWRDPRQYGPSAEALFRRHRAPRLLDGHITALTENAESEGRLACDAARARRLYDAWIGPPPAGPQEDLADECHDAFLGALLSHVQWAANENFDTKGEQFAVGRDALLALLREFAALKERPLGESPDFTAHISARLASEKSSTTHLAAAILFKAGYIPNIGPIFAQDPIFEPISNKYSPEDVTVDWRSGEALRLFQSASYYLVHGGPDCEHQIFVRMSGEGHGEAATACKDMLYAALHKYIWDHKNHRLRMDSMGDGWTLLNLVHAAKKQTRR